MLTTAEELLEALLGGGSAEELRPQVANLPYEEREMLLCALHSVRPEVAEICRERAVEIDRLLSVQPSPRQAHL
jgi:hypothetical protein